MFARANLGRAESFLTEIRTRAKKNMRKDWLKTVEAHIKDLDYRIETLEDRTLSTENEDLVPKLKEHSAALAGLVTVISEVMQFWRDGNPTTALAGIRAALTEIYKGDGAAIFAKGKFIPPYMLEDMLRLEAINVALNVCPDEIARLLQHEWIAMACCGAPDPQQDEKELRYRLLVQVMQTIAGNVSEAGVMRSVICSLCTQVCPELRSRTSRVLRAHASSESASDMDIDLETNSSREQTQQTLGVMSLTVQKELRVAAMFPFFRKFTHSDMQEAFQVHSDVSCPAMLRALFHCSVYRTMIQEAQQFFEAEKAFKTFCVTAMQKTRAFPTLCQNTRNLAATLQSMEMTAQEAMYLMKKWYSETMTGHGVAVLCDTDSVLEQLAAVSPEHTSKERECLEAYPARFIALVRTVFELCAHMLIRVSKHSVCNPETCSVEKRVHLYVPPYPLSRDSPWYSFF